MRHIALAFRTLRRTPFVTAIAVLSLALGIGANAAIYSLFDQLLARSLPVRSPDELVNLAVPGPKPGSDSENQSGGHDDVFSYPMFRDLERTQTVLSGLAAFRIFNASLSVRGEPFTSDAVYASGSYFPTLGIAPVVGRLLSPADDDALGAHFVTVLSHDLWASHFGSDPKVVGQTITVNGKALEILGVAPEDFRATTAGARPLLYVPISMRGTLSRFKDFDNRQSYWVYVFGRRKPGVTIAQAAAGLEAVYRPIITDVEAPLQAGMSAPTLALFKKKPITVKAGNRGQSQLFREASTPIFMLFGITGIVLLIACANIANLLLARGAGRATEMGVRLALGATRRHLLVQLMTESVILALAGGVASLVVAQWTLGLIGSFMPPDATNSMVLSLQPRVVVFAGLLALGTGFLFGMFPALHSTRADLITAIRAGAGQIAGGRSAARFRNGLVTAQIALSMALLISSGLFLKSLANVSRVDLGVRVDDMVTFDLSPRRTGYDSARSTALFRQVADELRAIPGVTAVTESMVPLLAGENWGNGVRVQGFPGGPDVDNGSRFNAVGPGYFATMGVTLTAGREFTPSDEVGGARVAVVNHAFAEKFKLGRDVVGNFMTQNDTGALNIQIVGLIPDIKYSSVKDSIPPVFYLPTRQDASIGSLYFYVRTSLAPAELLGTIRSVLRRLAPTVPVEDLRTMPQQVKDNIFLDRMISVLTAAFAFLATLLAGVGLYGVLAYSVAQRTREIGVRMALGADGGTVRQMVLRQVGGMLVVGGAVGIVAALGLGRAARSLLYGLEGHDPIVFGAAVLLLAVIALGAGWIPARRAAMIDPMLALRYD